MTFFDFLDRHTKLNRVSPIDLKRAGAYSIQAWRGAGNERPPKVEQKEGRQTYMVFDYPETPEVIAMMQDALQRSIQEGERKKALARIKKSGGNPNQINPNKIAKNERRKRQRITAQPIQTK